MRPVAFPSNPKSRSEDIIAEFLYKECTARRLPHFHPPDAILFVTFRLAGTVPKSVLRLYSEQKEWLRNETKRIEQLKLKDDSPEIQAQAERLREFQRQRFMRFEEILHRAETGPTWLKNNAVAKLAADALRYRDGSIFRLDCYCIMPNHVHVVFAPYLTESELRETRSSEGLIFLSQNPLLDAIMKSLKGFTAWEANQCVGTERHLLGTGKL